MDEIQIEEGSRGQAKREQILEASRRVFLREGFAAASIDVLAHEAHVSKRTLYAYYASKEELFVDMVRTLTLYSPKTRVLDFVQALNPRDTGELREALQDLAQRVITTMMRPEDLAMLRTIVADAHRFPQLTDMLRSTIPERAAMEISLMLERARSNGVRLKPGDTEIMTRLFMGPILSYVLFDGLLRPENQPQIPATQKLNTLVALFLYAILENDESERNQR